MKQYKLIILLALLFLASGQVSMAQFKVLASSGEISPKVNSKTAYVGTPVTSSSKIIVPPKGFISLLHIKTRGTVEISKAGTYTGANLEKELLKRSGQSTGQRYANYIIGELTKAGGKDIHKNPYAYSNVTGSVERAIQLSPNKVSVLMPKSTHAFDTEYVISWYANVNAQGYKLKIQNEFDEVVKVVETKDTFALVKLDIPELEGVDIKKMIVVCANNEDIDSEDFAITEPEGNSLENIEKELKSLDLSANGPASDKLLAALIYEYNGFFIDAMKTYQTFIKSSPDYVPYQVAYNQFLIRFGLDLAQGVEANNK